MLSKRSRVYQTSISMSTGGGPPPSNFGNFSRNSENFPKNCENYPRNSFNLANPSLIPQPVISQAAR